MTVNMQVGEADTMATTNRFIIGAYLLAHAHIINEIYKSAVFNSYHTHTQHGKKVVSKINRQVKTG